MADIKEWVHFNADTRDCWALAEVCLLQSDLLVYISFLSLAAKPNFIYMQWQERILILNIRIRQTFETYINRYNNKDVYMQ